MWHIPELIDISPELQLEKIAQYHCSSMFLHIDQYRDYLSQYVDWTQFNTKVEDSHHFVELCENEAEKGISFVWAICWQGNCVGTISFNKPIDWQNRTALIGYWLSPEAQGMGIVTQSVNAVIESTQAHFSCYVLRCAVHNQASNNVAKRCGFTFIETAENAEKIGETLCDQNVYHKLVGQAVS